MRLAKSRDLRDFSDVTILNTPKNFNAGVKLFVETARKISAGEKIKAIAGGAPGPLSPEKDKITNAPNLSSWNGKPLKFKLGKTLKAPVFLENDTAIVGLGEVWHGAGKKYAKNGIAAYITISTGVGGARIVDGKIDRNSFGFEIGAQTIDASGKILPKINHMGYLENFISGSSFEKRFHKKPYEITDAKVWEESARLLAYGLNNTIVHWSPDAVVLGGSMMKKVGIPINRVNYHLNRILKIFPQKPKLLKARLGDLGGLHGAMIYLKQNMRY